MISSLSRKISQIIVDPVLRRWLIGRALGRLSGGPGFTAHFPPYLAGLQPLTAESPSTDFTEMADAQPSGPVELALAGEMVTVEPGAEAALFARPFNDIEMLLSLHRFAWIGQLEDKFDPAWVNALWKAWRLRFATPDGDWPWHPYTAGERAVNLIDFASRHGLPGPINDTVEILAAHGPAIAERLEYFGDHHTSNHLANNGRALLVLGCVFGMEKTAVMGARILIEEADRIFTPSGMLREGSSHYHLLLTRLYEEAVRYCDALEPVARKARKAAEALLLPGGLPLIGDISPDISPEDLLSQLKLEPRHELAGDGWLRMDAGKWSGLWHASPDGFSHMPGHGHQDTGSFELHYEDEAVVVDPGRGAYGDYGESALYRSATMHNGLIVDGENPFPPNKPYYDETFRRAVVGSQPQLKATETGVCLGWKDHQRNWEFNGNRLIITDKINGNSMHTITRTLITPLDVELESNGVVMNGQRNRYRIVCAECDVSVEPVTRWHAYGRGERAYAITLSKTVTLPFSGRITLEAL